MGWPVVKISSVCKTGSGGTPSRSKLDEYYGGIIPWIKSGELNGGVITSSEEHITELALKMSSAKLVNKGAILVAMYGATVGNIATLGIDAATNQAVCHIEPDRTRLYPGYLHRVLQSKVPELLSKRVGGAQPNINQGIIKDTEIPLPPLAEQIRIATILDKADAIRRKRQGAIALADTFLPSVFLKMFGDPVTNPMGWDVRPFGEVVLKVIGGWSAQGEDRLPYDDEKAVLKVSAVTYGVYRPKDCKAVSKIPKNKKLIVPQVGDLLFSRANTRQLVAATCIVTRTHENVFLPDKLWRIDTDKQRILPEYVKYLFSHPRFREQISHQATGTSGSMLNISKQKLLEIDVPIPEYKKQEQFAELFWKMNDVFSKLQRMTQNSNDFFSSLQQRAFRGDL